MKYELVNPPKTLCKKDAKWLENHNIVILKGKEAVWILDSEMVKHMKGKTVPV